jgi:hypothetical protein
VVLGDFWCAIILQCGSRKHWWKEGLIGPKARMRWAELSSRRFEPRMALTSIETRGAFSLTTSFSNRGDGCGDADGEEGLPDNMTQLAAS